GGAGRAGGVAAPAGGEPVILTPARSPLLPRRAEVRFDGIARCKILASSTQFVSFWTRFRQRETADGLRWVVPLPGGALTGGPALVRISGLKQFAAIEQRGEDDEPDTRRPFRCQPPPR